MEYNKMKKEQLINRIYELEYLVEQLKKEKEQQERLEFAWTGNLGHWYWNYKTNIVTFNRLKLEALGYTKKEIPKEVRYQFFTDKIHPDDYDRAMNSMKEHITGESDVYEVEYRIKTKQGNWKWFYDRGKVTKRDKDNKPILIAGIVFDISERKQMESKLKNYNNILKIQAATDSLTCLFNHKTIYEKLKKEVIASKNEKLPLSILMIDIDNFKNVNDTYGHLLGDKVLIEMSNTIMNNIRQDDLVGRYGGEEFMIIFPNTDIVKARVISERLRKEISKLRFTNEFSITISGGLAQYDNESIEELIRISDDNLYRAKRNGKNMII